jgi:hypothetical protein
LSAPARTRPASARAAWARVGFLLGLLGGLFGLLCCVAGLILGGLGAGQLPGLGAGLADRGVPVGFGGRDPGDGVSVGRLDSSVPVGGGGGAGCVGLVGAGLGGGQLGGDLFGNGVGFRAPLVSFGGALLGGGAYGFGGGRVCDRLDGIAEPCGDVGDPVGFGAQLA